MESTPFSWRSSELWVAIASGVGTILTALGWIPWETWEKVLYPAVVYIIGRLTSKTAKANIAPLLLGMTILSLTLAPPLYAQQAYPMLDWEHRAQISFSSGYLQVQDAGGGETWRGVDLAGSLTYSVHPLASIWGIYAHGFPFEGSRHENQARIAANLLFYPAPGAPRSVWSFIAGAGVMWRGSETVRDWNGIETHLTGTAVLNPWLGAFATYLHGFSSRPETNPDFDQLRAGLTARAWP